MNDGLKQRLIGALVLTGIAVIFLPGFFKEQQLHQVDTRSQIPPRPETRPIVIEAPRPVQDNQLPEDPDTLFMPESDQPVADDLAQLEQSYATSSVLSSDESREAVSSSSSSEVMASSSEMLAASSAPDSDPLATPEAWVVQVASLRSAESAQQLRKKLQERGYKAYVRLAQTSQGQVSRVFIGPKIDKALAEAVKAEIDPAFKVNSLVLKFAP